MGNICSHWRAPGNGGVNETSDQQKEENQENCSKQDRINCDIGPDTEHINRNIDLNNECMSQPCHDSDVHGNTSNYSLLNDHQEDNISSAIANSSREINGQPVESHHKDGQIKLKNSILNMLKVRYKEVFVVIVITILLFTARNNGSLMTRKVATPVKFFNSPLITDFEYGELRKAVDLSKRHEVTMTMYYAPWDLDCQRLKKEFETVANHFDGQINFVAINCWWPDGECSKQVSIKRFPVLSAFLGRLGQVEYKGPLVASYIIPFLDNLLDPVTTVNNDGDLLELRSKHDAVAVGFFDFHDSARPNGYENFMSAAVRSLTFDPWRKVQYSIVTSRRVAFKLYIEKPSSIAIYLWNSTAHIMSSDFKPDVIIKSVFDHVNSSPSLVQWITPSGIKSSALSSILTEGPTMILFTPRSLILGISPFFETLRETAMDYYNCDNSPQIKSLIHRSILRRVAMENTLMELDEKCHELYDPIGSSSIPSAVSSESCCYSQSVKWKPPVRLGLKRCFCTACVQMTKSKCPGGCESFNCLATATRFLSTFEPSTFVNRSTNYCNQIKTKFQPRYTPYYSIDVACTGLEPDSDPSDFVSRMNPSLKSSEVSDDDRISRMINSFETGFCSRLQLGLNYSDLNFPESGEGSGYSQSWRKDFTGLACRTNKTLNFIAMDSILFPTFAEHLGIDVLNETHSTVAVIVEEPQENVYLLSKNIISESSLNKRAMYQFIKNYSSNALPRFVRSQSISSSTCSESSICVPEVSSTTFSRIVLDSRNDVILMYYTPWCGFCSSIAHVYLSVAHMLRYVDNLVFARINVGQHELPFEYSVERIPSLILYPSRIKSSSILFPPKELVSENSLIEFIVKNSSPSSRKLISLMICEGKCLRDNLFSTTSHIKKLNRQIKRIRMMINDVNREYSIKSKTSTKKNAIAKILNQLKSKLILSKLHLEMESRYLSKLVMKSSSKQNFNPEILKSIKKLLPVQSFRRDPVVKVDSRTKFRRKHQDEL